jgi:proteasome accessory factor C
MVPYLLSRGEVRLDEAARHFGVSAEQVDQDLRLLFMTGLPQGMPDDLIEVDIEALEGDGVIRVGNADYLARPVRFAPAEATALVVALRAMAEDATDEDARAVLQRTLDKLEQVLADAGEQPALHVQGVGPDAHQEVGNRIRQAVAAGKQVRIEYFVPTRDEVSERVIDPRGVARVGDASYVDAWCHQAQGLRAFRVDRILSCEVLDTDVADPTARPRDLTGAWFSDGEVTRVTLRLEPAAWWVREYYSVAGSRPGPEGTWEVDLDVASQDWVQQLLFRLAPHAQVVAPQHVQGAFEDAAAQALHLYDEQHVD